MRRIVATFSPGAPPPRTWIALGGLLTLILLTGADAPLNASDRAQALAKLQVEVLANPYDLQKLDDLRRLRTAQHESHQQTLEALADGLTALLKDDHARVAALLAEVRSAPEVRELARAQLSGALWQELFAPIEQDGRLTEDAASNGNRRLLRTMQNLCPACGHTGRMDCRQCRGDGDDRGETCPRCQGTGVEACVHVIHRVQAGEQTTADRPPTLSADDRRRVHSLIDIARYLVAGGVDWFSPAAIAPSPRVRQFPE